MAQVSSKPSRALILDFDGVVVDTEALHFQCWNRAFQELLGFQVEGDPRQLVGLSLAGIYDLWSQSTSTPVTLGEAMRRRLLTRKTELFFELGQEHLSPMPGLVSLVRRAHQTGWYVTIASRALRMRLLRTLEMVGLPPFFDLVMGYEDAVDPNTDRKQHSRAGLPFGVAGNACVTVEDSLSGVADARACGIGWVIGFTSSLDRNALQAAGAHATVDHLEQIDLEQVQQFLQENACP